MLLNVKTKICCIQSLDEAQTAITHGADILGFVSEMPSGPGVIDEEVIAEIIARVHGSVETFLLTSKTTVDEIVAQQARCHASALQLCRPLTIEHLRELKDRLPHTELVYVVHVKGQESVDEAVAVAREADAILLDSSTKSNGVDQLGGTGLVHDWNISRKIVEAVKIPVFLAGGLNASNVLEAIEKVRPSGVDVCTGVRTEWSLDGEKLRAFVEQIKDANGMREMPGGSPQTAF